MKRNGLIRSMLPLAGGLATALLVVATAQAQNPAGAAAAQGRGAAPAPPQNLQVLPKDISRQDLQAVMRTYATGLGVQCNYCHVAEGRGGRNDFAADDKQTKKTARVMMTMTAHINETLGTGVGKTAADVTKVECGTCHRGQAIPKYEPPPPPAAGQPGAAPR